MSALIGKDVVSLFVVEERVGEDAWEKAATYIDGWYKNTPDITALRSHLLDLEKEVKDYFVIKTMPSKWRSAKSVALKAIEQGIPLMNTDGAFGKSAVEKALKSMKSKSTPMAPADHYYSQVVKAVNDAVVNLPSAVEFYSFIDRCKSYINSYPA